MKNIAKKILNHWKNSVKNFQKEQNLNINIHRLRFHNFIRASTLSSAG